MNRQKKAINLVFGTPLIVAFIIGATLLAVYAPTLLNTPAQGDGLSGKEILRCLIIASSVALCYYLLVWRCVYRLCTDARHRIGYIIIDTLSIFCAAHVLICYIVTCFVPFIVAMLAIFAASVFVKILALRAAFVMVYHIIYIIKRLRSKIPSET